MKTQTFKITGAAFTLAVQLNNIIKDGEARVKQLQSDIDAVQAVIQKEANAKLAELVDFMRGHGHSLPEAGTFAGSVDMRYLEHGDLYLIVSPQQSFADILEGLAAKINSGEPSAEAVQ